MQIIKLKNIKRVLDKINKQCYFKYKKERRYGCILILRYCHRIYMKYSQFLKINDTIGVTAPSSGSANEIDLARLNFAKENFIKLGYNVKETTDCRSSFQGRSATAVQRANEFNELIIDNNINAIIGLTGGDFLVEMLSYVNWKAIKDNPKWIQGFSDMTGLTFLITTNCDIATIYGNNFRGFSMENFHKSLYDNIEILKGSSYIENSYDMYQSNWRDYIVGNEEYDLDKTTKWINLNKENEINIRGRMIGGCLDVLVCLVGTKFDKTEEFIDRYKEDGIIWYFDNCELNNEEIVRAMWQFKEAGYFKYVKGIVFGRTNIDESSYEISFKEAIKTSLNELNVPIIIEADIGHRPPQMAVVNGSIARIHSQNGIGTICFEYI